MGDVSGDFFIFQQAVDLHIGHVTLCDFLSSQHPLSFLLIRGRRMAPTLIRSITRRGDIQQRVHQSQLHSTDELKKRFLDVWHDMYHSVIDNAIDE